MSTPQAGVPLKVTVPAVRAARSERRRLVMVTAYDAPSGRFADAAGVDIVLVGDSLGMTALGRPDTLSVTLAEMVQYLPRIPRPKVRFVSLLGSLTRHAAANPFDVIHRLTEITGAESYFMPAPFFADSVEDKAVLLGQRSLEAVFALARTAELVVVGIGEVGPDSHLLTSGMITPEELGEVERAGAVGELLGRFVDAQGRAVAAGVNERAVAVRLEEMPGRQVVAIAGGRNKARAIAARTAFASSTGTVPSRMRVAGSKQWMTPGSVPISTAAFIRRLPSRRGGRARRRARFASRGTPATCGWSGSGTREPPARAPAPADPSGAPTPLARGR